MKDYTLDSRKKGKYIVSCKEEDGKYKITFADGTKFVIDVNEENFYKINDRLERQSETALKNYDKFVLRREKAKFGAGISAIGTIAAGACVSALPVVQSSANPVVLATAIGTIAVCSTIPNLVKISKENSRIKELQKIFYRNKKWDEINSYSDYSNALQGVKKTIAKKIEESPEPFAMINIDNFDIESLKKIVENIEREDEYEFTYSGEEKVEDVENTDSTQKKR